MQKAAIRRSADHDHDDARWNDQDRDRGNKFSDGVPSRPGRLVFSTDEPAVVYVSPFRHGKPAAPATPQPARARARTSSPIGPAPRPNLFSASASSIARSAQHKSASSAKFKLGQYADAETAYYTADLTVVRSLRLSKEGDIFLM
jgi:hypothetical protein